MSTGNLTTFVNDARATLSKHRPAILMGIGIAGMVTTVGLAVYATPKAISLIDEKKLEEGLDELTALEIVKTCWKCYVNQHFNFVCDGTRRWDGC